jgi:hypothetical protein
MAYASQSGRARTSPRNPRAFAVCQRCGFWYNRDQLHFQFDWRGAQLQNLYILVCRDGCTDEPQEQLRAITLPADPTPIFYPSVEDFAGDSTDYRAVNFPLVVDPVSGIPIPSTVLRTTQECQNRTTGPYGNPSGLDPAGVMPLQILNGQPVHYGTVLPILSVYSTSTVVTVTCSAVHNLHPGDQIAVSGLTAGNGFYSVLVPTATVFSFETTIPVMPALTATTRMITVKIGLPYGYVTIPEPYGAQVAAPVPGPTPPTTVPGPPTNVVAT